MNLMTWLAQPYERELPFEYGAPPPLAALAAPSRLQVYAALLYMNGGETVRGWGVTQSGGIYGTIGLEMSAALSLIQFTSFVAGMLEATEGAERPALSDAINAEIARAELWAQGQVVAQAQSGQAEGG